MSQFYIEPKNNKLLGEIIDLMRAHGVKVESSYDLENWIEDYANDSRQFWATKRFDYLLTEKEKAEMALDGDQWTFVLDEAENA